LTDHEHECDYASNVLHRTYPRGLDVEAFFWDTLLRIDRLARSDASREHVTIVPRSEHPELFLGRSVKDNQNNADLRWTVDTATDLEFIRQLYTSLNLNTSKASYLEILGYVRNHIELVRRDEIETWDPSR
jgi:spore coat polysaccharide biosynthesis protein SpsF